MYTVNIEFIITTVAIATVAVFVCGVVVSIMCGVVVSIMCDVVVSIMCDVVVSIMCGVVVINYVWRCCVYVSFNVVIQ